MEENESSKGRYKTYSAEFKIAKIEEFMKSEKSEAAFCRDEGICLSTFRSWRCKSGIAKAVISGNEKDNLTLVDVTDRIQNAMRIITLPEREVSFSINGFLIKVSEKDLKTFLRGMRAND